MDVANPVADSVPADDAFLIVIFISNKVISELFFLSMSVLFESIFEYICKKYTQ